MRIQLLLLPALVACSSPQNDGDPSATGGTSGSAHAGGGGQVSGGASGQATGGSTNSSAGSAGAPGSGGGSAGESAAGTSSAGGAAQGGTNQGGGTHIAGPCSDLPEAGTWENISAPGATGSGLVTIDPFDSAVVWTNNKLGVNKSTDCGATWTLVSTGTNGPGLADSSLWSMAVDPIDQGTIYLVGGYGALSLWKSTNGGVDWSNLFPPASEYATHAAYDFANNVSMDPSDHLHLVVATHGSCSAPYDPNCDAETTDGGQTWQLTKAPSGWPEGGGVFLVDAKTWLWCDPFGGIWRSEDNGATFDPVRDGYGGNGEFTTHPLYPASDGNYYLSSIGGILQSSDAGKTWVQVHDGRWVGLAMSSTTLYAADQWSPHFASAPIANPSEWSDFPAPPGLPDNQGAPYLEYDEDHHLLYASTWPGGLWRIVTQ